MSWPNASIFGSPMQKDVSGDRSISRASVNRSSGKASLGPAQNSQSRAVLTQDATMSRSGSAAGRSMMQPKVRVERPPYLAGSVTSMRKTSRTHAAAHRLSRSAPTQIGRQSTKKPDEKRKREENFREVKNRNDPHGARHSGNVLRNRSDFPSERRHCDNAREIDGMTTCVSGDYPRKRQRNNDNCHRLPPVSPKHDPVRVT